MRTHGPRWTTRLAGAAFAALILLNACGTDPVTPQGGDDGRNVPRVNSVVVSPAAPSLRVGESTVLSAEVRDQNGASMAGQAVAWTSGSASIATVSGNGTTATVTAISAGSALVLASVGGVSGSATVSVAAPPQQAPVALVRCAPASVTIPVGQTVALQSTAFDAAGNIIAGRPVSWSATPTSVATVTATGVVTGVSAGTAQITTIVEGQSSACIVTVTSVTSQVTLVVTNQLIATVQILVNGAPVGTVPAQSTRQTTVASTASMDVTFEVIEPRLGTRVLGDRMSGRWTLTAPTGTVNLNVDNLVGSQWYFAPLVNNLTGTSLLMAVNFGLQAENRCQCVVPPGGQRVFLGYYRLYSNSVLHAFRDGSSYTGPYWYFYDFGNAIARGSGVREFTFNVAP
ncbi:MAG: Ig-like domain-containing protein [Gemmatimonadaceae bacterium]|nr:Ig-like domain-containing protein [Gemmatimonadaceae bacterium]